MAKKQPLWIDAENAFFSETNSVAYYPKRVWQRVAAAVARRVRADEWAKQRKERE